MLASQHCHKLSAAPGAPALAVYTLAHAHAHRVARISEVHAGYAWLCILRGRSHTAKRNAHFAVLLVYHVYRLGTRLHAHPHRDPHDSPVHAGHAWLCITTEQMHSPARTGSCLTQLRQVAVVNVVRYAAAPTRRRHHQGHGGGGCRCKRRCAPVLLLPHALRLALLPLL